jgi:hypothetical protein
MADMERNQAHGGYAELWRWLAGDHRSNSTYR